MTNITMGDMALLLALHEAIKSATPEAVQKEYESIKDKGILPPEITQYPGASGYYIAGMLYGMTIDEIKRAEDTKTTLFMTSCKARMLMGKLITADWD